MHGSQRCSGELVELTADEIRQIKDADVEISVTGLKQDCGGSVAMISAD